MKYKKKMALALITVLSLSAWSLSVFADTPAIDSSSETIVQETQKDQHHQRGRKDKTTCGTADDQSRDSETENAADQSRGHGRHDGKSAAEPENAIGKDTAQAKAMEDAGVTEEQAGKVKSRVSQLDDGTVVYKVHFKYNDQHYSYKINAVTGEIVDKRTDTAVKDKTTESHGHDRHSKEENNTSADSSSEAASAAA